MPDVLLHVTCLRRDGFQTAYEGARIVCEVQQRSKGLQAFRVLSIDKSTAVHPAQMPPPRTHVVVTATSGLERAQVKWFNRLRGFGFLTRGEGTPDIFVHMETLRRYGLAELRPGQTVLVRFGTRTEGLDGGRGPPGQRIARSRLALISPTGSRQGSYGRFFHCRSASPRKGGRMRAFRWIAFVLIGFFLPPVRSGRPKRRRSKSPARPGCMPFRWKWPLPGPNGRRA